METAKNYPKNFFAIDHFFGTETEADVYEIPKYFYYSLFSVSKCTSVDISQLGWLLPKSNSSVDFQNKKKTKAYLLTSFSCLARLILIAQQINFYHFFLIVILGIGKQV